ncbi:MAG: hypothetical protein AAF581_18965 [Planctomycetota bacterium]
MRIASLLWFRWCLACVTVFASLPVEGAILSNLRPLAVLELRECQAMLQAGRIDDGLRRLQALHEETLVQRSLVPVELVAVEHQASPNDYRCYQALEQRTLALFFASPAYLSAYEEIYGLVGCSHYEAARKGQDPEALLTVARRFPLLPEAWQAALMAGDLWLERGRSDRAIVAWQLFPRAGLPVKTRQHFDRRLELLASWESSHPNAHWRGWSLEADAVPAQPVPTGHAEKSDEPSPHAKASKKTRIEVDLVWSSNDTFDPDRLVDRYSQRSPYAARVVGMGNTVVAASARHLLEFQIDTGQCRKWSLPKALQSYRETSRLWFPAMASQRKTLACSYLRSASRQLGRGRSSGLIKVPVPKRALAVWNLAAKNPTKLWDSSKVDDPTVRQLSFNSDPILIGERLYALGWCQKGLVDAYCVAFDIAKNRVLWKTLLVSGQVDLTRFGELALEPQMGDLLLDGASLYVSTNLGVCAALTLGEGRVRWLTHYLSVLRSLTIEERRRLRYPHRNRCVWLRNPLVAVRGGILATPLDSERAFLFDRSDGRVRQWREASGSPGYSLGRWQDRVVFCDSDECVIVPEDHIDADGVTHALEQPLRARPALVAAGLVYASEAGLYLLPFAGGERQIRLASFDAGRNPKPRGRRAARRGSAPLDGTVTVVPAVESQSLPSQGQRHILVTHSYGVRCYRISPH